MANDDAFPIARLDSFKKRPRVLKTDSMEWNELASLHGSRKRRRNQSLSVLLCTSGPFYAIRAPRFTSHCLLYDLPLEMAWNRCQKFPNDPY